MDQESVQLYGIDCMAVNNGGQWIGVISYSGTNFPILKAGKERFGHRKSVVAVMRHICWLISVKKIRPGAAVKQLEVKTARHLKTKLKREAVADSTLSP